MSRNYLVEEKNFVNIYFPVWIFIIGGYGLTQIGSAYFAGQMGDDWLAGINLGLIIPTATIAIFMIGFSSVFDVYGPQLCGRNEPNELGRLMVKVIFQGLVAFLVFLGPFFGIIYSIDLFPTGSVSKTGDTKNVKKIAKAFMVMMIPSHLIYYVMEIIFKFFTNHRAMVYVYTVSALQAVLYLVLCYIFVIQIEMKSHGIVLAIMLSQITTLGCCIFILFYKRKEWHLNNLLDRNIFSNFKEMFGIGCAGGMNQVFAYISYAVALYLSQIGGRVEVEVVGLSFQYENFSWAASVAIAYTSAIQVGNAIGGKKVSEIRFYIGLNGLNLMAERVMFLLFMLISRHWIFRMVTQNTSVLSSAMDSSYLYAGILTLTSLQEFLGRGVLMAFGKAKIVSITVILCTTLIGLPIMVLLSLFTNLKENGLFLGILSEKVMEILVFVISIWRLDYDEEIKECSNRLERESGDKSRENEKLVKR